MKLKAECTWGEAIDVLLVIQDDTRNYLDSYDLTSQKALLLAKQLTDAAYEAMKLQQMCEDYDDEVAAREESSR